MDIKKYKIGTKLLFTNVGYFSPKLVQDAMRLYGITPNYGGHLPSELVFDTYGKDYAISAEIGSYSVGWQSYNYWFGTHGRVTSRSNSYEIINIKQLYCKRNKYIKKPKIIKEH